MVLGRITDFRLEQPLKAYAGMDVTPSGIVIVRRLVQPLNIFP